MTSDLPLTGTVVLALEQAVAAPLATRHLADLGARVVKVERPGVGDFARGYDRAVDGTSSYVFWLNRGKESLTLDVKSAGGREVLERLLDRADVLVHNLAPGALDRLGLDAAALRTRWPRLVSCGLSGYGTGGPYDGKRAYDLLVQAEVGIPSITGTPEQGVRIGLSIADIAGGVYAFSSVLAALLARARTGRGAVLETSLLDALTEWTSPALYQALHGGGAPARTADSHPTLYPYGPFACADGPLVLGVQNDREWGRLCREVLDRPELADDPRFARNVERSAHRALVDAAVAPVLARLTRSEAAERLDRAGVAWGRANDLDGLAAHPQLVGRDRWRDVGTPAGPRRAVLPPLAVPEGEPGMGPVPALGEHTDAVLGWLGYSSEQVAALRAAGAC